MIPPSHIQVTTTPVTSEGLTNSSVEGQVTQAESRPVETEAQSGMEMELSGAGGS